MIEPSICFTEGRIMNDKAVLGMMLMLLLLNSMFGFVHSLQGIGLRFSSLKCNNALIAPDLPGELSKCVASSSLCPSYYETSEYLLGSVACGVILPESTGAIDPSTEEWDIPAELQDVTLGISLAIDWWNSQNPSAGVNITVPCVHHTPTSYEPINRPQTDEGLWISEAMTYLGYPGTDYFSQVRDYVNALRDSTGTDWAFAIFVVDSSNDPDGMFADGEYFAYAYLGGPFLVMTYDNNGWGIGNMSRVAAHEIAHIFYATDEYDGITEHSGYLNVADVEGSGALMDTLDWWLSAGTEGQIGWRDSDGDDLQDIIDTFPDTVLNPYSPDPTEEPILTYTGTVTEIPHPNNNPHGTGRDVTINTITNVQFRVDGGSWIDATPIDGVFDEALEDFAFTTPTLEEGTHTIETRGINSVNNTETSYASDTITVRMHVHNINTGLNYSTIQGAIDAPETIVGHTIFVEQGMYYENVVVNKSISLAGENRSTTIIDGNQSGNVVTISANNASISSFTIQRSGNTSGLDSGIFLNHTKYCTIANSNITNNLNGIFAYHSSNNRIHENTVALNAMCPNAWGYGIGLRESDNNTVEDNILISNCYGIRLMNSAGNTLSNNNMTGNTFNFGVYVWSGLLAHFIHNISASNTVNGKPIHYLKNRYNITVDPTTFPNIGYLGIINSTNIVVKDINISKAGEGILFAWTNSSAIMNVKSSDNHYGITLTSSRSNVVSDNTVEDIYHTGLITFFSDNNTIVSNSVFNSGWGFVLSNSSANRIEQNTVQNSGQESIRLQTSSQNYLYHNSFINFTYKQVLSFDSVNLWDSDCEGNFWSDYNGTDSNGDGIGDTPYVIDENNQDNCPLMSPYLLGDINHDGIVSDSDFLDLTEAYGSELSDDNWNCHCDFNGDNMIDTSDLFDLCKNYGRTG